MIKTILASLTGFGSDKAALDAAFAIALKSHSHVACLYTGIDPIEGAALVGVSTMQIHGNLLEITQRISREEQERSGHVTSAFNEACRRHGMPAGDDPEHAKGPSASLHKVTTFLNETLRRSRYHDLIAMARAAEISPERLHNIVMQSGRPVLIAPPKPVKAMGDRVMIAWKDGPEAARAVAAAMPILSHARHVTIVSVSENDSRADSDRVSAENAAEYLRWHGIKAKIQVSNSPATSISEKLEEIAFDLDADMLVMGAYGHSRMREFVFGGVTKDLLRACAVPLFMTH
jgi:nucleotide-binding universal stress UspA family protein